ncbi:MAG: hypothetical protein BZY88_17100 [SAR202 cluster bacterium Io17-Chloro-G9]|nr:MAG: hypothetical protein BZY88_17100 [SAR202 cluster bacterium Io17-Chloro-G9]
MSGERATWMYRFGRRLARFCFGTFGRLEVAGTENVPPHGPVILVCNHLSFTDPPLLVASIPRPLHLVGKKELFADPISRFLMRGFHVSPFDRSGSGIDAVRAFMGHLDQDRVVVLFPEGHRSPDHSMREGMLGVVYLALKSQAPILPVGVTGTQKFPGWRMPFPFCRLKSNIGQPFTLPVIEGKPSKEVMHSILDMIMDRIAAQLPPEYRGVYSEPGRSHAAQRVTVG